MSIYSDEDIKKKKGQRRPEQTLSNKNCPQTDKFRPDRLLISGLCFPARSSRLAARSRPVIVAT